MGWRWYNTGGGRVEGGGGGPGGGGEGAGEQNGRWGGGGTGEGGGGGGRINKKRIQLRCTDTFRGGGKKMEER